MRQRGFRRIFCDFFDFSESIKETLGAKKTTKKAPSKKVTKKIGKCAFIDGLIRQGLDKDIVTTKTIAKFPEDIADKTRSTVNARFSALRGENIQKARPKPGTKVDIDKEFPSTPFSCFYNPRTDDYDYYYN